MLDTGSSRYGEEKLLPGLGVAILPVLLLPPLL